LTIYVCKRDNKQAVTIINDNVLPPTKIGVHEKVEVRFHERPTNTSLLQNYADHLACG